MYGNTLPATGGMGAGLMGLGFISGSVWLILIGFFMIALGFAIWRIVPRNEE